MNRFVRCFLLLSVAGVMPLASSLISSDLAGLTLPELSTEIAPSEPTYLEQKMPWLHTRLVGWKEYLSKKPMMEHVQPKAHEEIAAQFSHTWATRAYNASGHKSDPSTLAFGRESFLVKDAFVASKLLARDEAKVMPKIDATQPLTNNNRHFLCLLAGQEVSFASSYSRQELVLSYKRAFLSKHLQVMVDIPLVRCESQLDLAMTAEISKANRAALVDATSMNSPLVRSAMGDMRTPVDAPGFYEQYSDMNNFLTHVLKDSGIMFIKKQEEIGLGDIAFTCVYDQPIRYVDSSSVGVTVSLNTAKSSRNVALAEPTLGAGASSIKTFAHLAWHRSLFANPFVKMSLGYSIPTAVATRMPHALTYNGVSHIGERLSEAFPRSIPFSDIVTLGGAAFSDVPESEVRGFASTLQKATLHKGLSYGMTIGNNFEQCFGKPMYASIAYSYARSQQHRLSDLEKAHLYAPHIVTKATATATHTLDALVGYRLSSLCTIEGGVRSCFAGKNTLKTTQVFGGLSLRF